MEMKYEGFIFDMDGVLIDSEPTYKIINTSLFNSLGFNVDDALYETFIGLGVFKMWAILKEKFNLPESLEHYVELDEEWKYSSFQKYEMEPIPGVENLILMLKEKGIKIAVASSSQRRTINTLLVKAGLLKYFELICSGDEIVNGKPAPDIFLKAADKIGIQPERCIVLEDSKNGVLGANAANMLSIAFINPNSGNQDLSAAKITITSYSKEILNMIASLME